MGQVGKVFLSLDTSFPPPSCPAYPQFTPTYEHGRARLLLSNGPRTLYHLSLRCRMPAVSLILKISLGK